jgi:hypothetical protein
LLTSDWSAGVGSTPLVRPYVWALGVKTEAGGHIMNVQGAQLQIYGCFQWVNFSPNTQAAFYVTPKSEFSIAGANCFEKTAGSVFYPMPDFMRIPTSINQPYRASNRFFPLYIGK